MNWKTSRRVISLNRPLVMGILNVTPDSFSDGGQYTNVDAACRRAESMIANGAEVIDIGGQSTRPGSERIDPDIEVKRTLPVVNAIAKRFDTPLSIDTFHWLVSKAALDHGAEIVNDISGLRWDARIAQVVANADAGLILMHSRGSFETMHSEPPADDILLEVSLSLKASIATAAKWGVKSENIALDIGLGFSKTLEQNLELIAKLDRLKTKFDSYPLLVGASRKSFIGRVTDETDPSKRLGGSLAAAIVAVQHGAKIVRVHDVRETVSALKMIDALEVI